ncbi:MAG: hypothetical protein ACLQHF_07720 [Terracidiphilus sp.]
MIEKIPYHGWKNAWRLSNGTVELIVLADVGPRIVHYGFCGRENVLYEAASDRGLTGGDEFRLYGGHRLWVWPEVARTYFPDNHAVIVSQEADCVRFRAPVEEGVPGTRLEKEFAVALDAGGTQVHITHTIANRSMDATELALWCPTMMRPGGRAILPLPPRAAMDADHFQSVGPMTLWSFTDLADPRWAFGTEFIQLSQASRPRGRFSEQMTGIFNPAGWGAYYAEGTLMIKHAMPLANARYPDFGCNFEIFTNPEFLELETLSPIVKLEPGESGSHTETWELFRDVPAGNDDAWARSTLMPLASPMSLV